MFLNLIAPERSRVFGTWPHRNRNCREKSSSEKLLKLVKLEMYRYVTKGNLKRVTKNELIRPCFIYATGVLKNSSSIPGSIDMFV